MCFVPASPASGIGAGGCLLGVGGNAPAEVSQTLASSWDPNAPVALQAPGMQPWAEEGCLLHPLLPGWVRAEPAPLPRGTWRGHNAWVMVVALSLALTAMTLLLELLRWHRGGGG